MLDYPDINEENSENSCFVYVRICCLSLFYYWNLNIIGLLVG